MSRGRSTVAATPPFASPAKAANDILPCATFNSETEETFVERVYADTCTFAVLSESDKTRGTVLVFPPVSSRLRFFIHQIVEINLPTLKTFSVGSLERRTVVCRRDIYKMEIQQEKTPEAPPARVRKQRAVNERAIYRPPPARTVGAPEPVKQNPDPAPASSAKKPSKEIYVPPCRKYSSALKTEESEPAQENGHESKGIPILVTVPKSNSRKSTREEARLAVEEDLSRSPTLNKEENTKAPPQVNRKISRTGSIPVMEQQSAKPTVDLGDLMASCELAELSNQVPLDKPLPSPSRLQKEISYEEDSWEKLYNESGDFLKPDAMEELTLAVGSVRIVQPKHEIYSQVSENPDEDLSHVIEVYDFPSAFKTEDLYNALNTVGSKTDFMLKWVDDTHALAVYSNTTAAMDALASGNSLIKMRPLAQATKESRNTARRVASALLPYKPRPATSATMAKRLVTGALGIKSIVSPEQRQKERKLLADAKERKKLAAQQKEAAWEGTFETP